MEVSCTSCLSQLLLKLLQRIVVKRLPLKATSQLLHGTVMQKLLHELWHATVVQKPIAKLVLKLLRGSIVQKLRCEGLPQPLAWSCPAKAAFRNYCGSFCVALSCKGCLAKLFLELFHGTVVRKVFRKAILHFLCRNVAQKNCQAEVLGAVCAMLGAVRLVYL